MIVQHQAVTGWVMTRVVVQMRVTHDEKGAWERAAWSADMDLSKWLKGLANAESGHKKPVETLKAAGEHPCSPESADEVIPVFAPPVSGKMIVCLRCQGRAKAMGLGPIPGCQDCKVSS